MDHPPPKPALDRVAIERSGRADRSADAVLEDLSHVLWHQRQLIVDLVYRLEVQKLVLASGMTRWIANAATWETPTVATASAGSMPERSR